MKRTNPLGRRTFLRGVGGAALAAPFLSSLQEQSANAQTAGGGAPVRSVIFCTHNGCLTNRWFPKVADGVIDAAALSGTTLEGLSPFASKLLFPRGLEMYNSYAQIQTCDPHGQAMGSKLTCALLAREDTQDDDNLAISHSLDYEIAQQVNAGTDKSPLVLSVGSGGGSGNKNVLSYSGPETPSPVVTNPKTVYTQLTGLFTTGGGEIVTEADYMVARGKSIIDIVGDDLRTFQGLNMSQSDQRATQDWLDLLRSTEQSIVVPTGCTAEAAMALGITDAALDEAGSGGFGAGLGTAFTKGGDMMMNLMALSMICDANRSLVLVYPGYVTFDWDDVSHDADHHGLSHRNGSFDVGGECKAGVLDMIAEIDTWYASKYVRLVTLLDSLSEGEGTLLDNTMTMWLPELSDGNAHNTNNMPICIAGSGGGYLKQGVSVNVDGGGDIDTGDSEADCSNGDTSVGFGTGSRSGHTPVNKLYVTMMNAVGCTAPDGGPVTDWGQIDSASRDAGITDPGELSELKA